MCVIVSICFSPFYCGNNMRKATCKSRNYFHPEMSDEILQGSQLAVKTTKKE